ncbi:hypothetical protein OUZ56_012086 [Daphnia magna]|uniref:Uncharacterized protein n=1 Tax=Daphnia magna TaxID=35525 RepID=A0ABQ9Z201_9CRUS|nr:hypothetical protein OUZ56_012086 [Daphnia magna]
MADIETIDTRNRDLNYSSTVLQTTVDKVQRFQFNFNFSLTPKCVCQLKPVELFTRKRRFTKGAFWRQRLVEPFQFNNSEELTLKWNSTLMEKWQIKEHFVFFCHNMFLMAFNHPVRKVILIQRIQNCLLLSDPPKWSVILVKLDT